ncbi:tyrosine-type recombinase/integrase [Fundidesulfovibrio butyratiphilus]
MSVYQRDGRYMVYYKEDGKRRDKSFGRGETARQQAEAFDQAVRQAKEQGATLPDPSGFIVESSGQQQQSEEDSGENSEDPGPAPRRVKDRGGGITFGELSKLYLNHLRVSGRTDKHIVTVAGLLKNLFFDVLGRDAPVESMTYLDDVVPFIRHMQGVSEHTRKPRSQTSVNRYCDYVDAIFNFGVEMGLTTVNPMKGRKKAREQPRDVRIGIEDVKRIMEAAEPHVRWAMEVCFNLGTRPGRSELLSLRWDHVDFTKSMVRIYATKTKTFRSVPVTAAFLDRLREMKAQSQSSYLIEYRGKPVTSIRKSFHTACDLAGIKVPVRMYDLRHLFATTMLSNGADLAAVSKLMGHSTVKMTADVYYHYLEGEKERAVSKLPSLVAV